MFFMAVVCCCCLDVCSRLWLLCPALSGAEQAVDDGRHTVLDGSGGRYKVTYINCLQLLAQCFSRVL